MHVLPHQESVDKWDKLKEFKLSFRQKAVISSKSKLNKKLLLYIYLYVLYYHFYSENFYKFKSPLANKELRIFSIRIKYFFLFYIIILFIFIFINKFFTSPKDR